MSYGKCEIRTYTEKICDVTRRRTEIYALKNSIEPSARALLCTDIRTHLEQPTWVIQNWLTIYGSSYFQASAKKVTTSPVDTPTLPSSVRHPPGAILFVGRAQPE
jgi:hypothetical protein